MICVLFHLAYIYSVFPINSIFFMEQNQFDKGLGKDVCNILILLHRVMGNYKTTLKMMMILILIIIITTLMIVMVTSILLVIVNY